MSLDTIAYWIGAGVMVALAILLLAGLLWLAFYVLGKVGERLWHRTRKVYHLHAMRYWFQRMDAEGTHCLKVASGEVKAQWETDRAKKAAK